MKKASYAIMFVDINGSTKLYDQLGDESAKQIMDT
jgi:class 3 adenylate cyclase